MDQKEEYKAGVKTLLKQNVGGCTWRPMQAVPLDCFICQKIAKTFEDGIKKDNND